MKLNSSAEGMKEALRNHVRYEVEMLRATGRRLETMSTDVDPIERNVFIESFCIHARNLFDFFDGNGSPASGYAAARHFADSAYMPFPNGHAFRGLIGKLSKQVAHITYDRTSGDGQLKGPDIRQIYELIEKEIHNFSNHLKPVYLSEWSEGRSPVRYVLQIPNSTCTSFSQTITVVSSPRFSVQKT